jgi:2-polyprenyl-3-methyl-5-hydroxy-6-metoxy-1,4-benzoquinol methylase
MNPKNEITIYCPACSSADITQKEDLGDYHVIFCNECELFFSDPMRPGDEKYYKSHIVYEDANAASAIQQKESVNKRINRRILKKFPKGTLSLDIGCGYGAFVSLAQDYGLDAYGIDFNSEQVQVGSNVYKLQERLKVCSVNEVNTAFKINTKFDLITMFEVIEHVDNPRRLLEDVYALLKPDGTLIISCPNESRWMPAGRIFVDYPPHHLTRWSPAAIKNLLAALHFKNTSVNVHSNLRDILWTYYCNKSARSRQNSKNNEKLVGSKLVNRSLKYFVYQLLAVIFFPIDLGLKALKIGTMGMHVYAKKPKEPLN